MLDPSMWKYPKYFVTQSLFAVKEKIFDKYIFRAQYRLPRDILIFETFYEFAAIRKLANRSNTVLIKLFLTVIHVHPE